MMGTRPSNAHAENRLGMGSVEPDVAFRRLAQIPRGSSKKSRTLATAVIANVRSNLFIETDPQFPSANRREEFGGQRVPPSCPYGIGGLGTGRAPHICGARKLREVPSGGEGLIALR